MSGHKPRSDRGAAPNADRPPQDIEAPQRLSWGEVTKLNEQRGSDPYNTSGSFDRTKNWARVGKR
jgi:hypothetical protein